MSRKSDKNKLKKEYLGPLRKYAEQLEKENHALKTDPNSVIGQFIGQFRELYSQNSRLSVLAASLIRKLGESVVLTKDEMEAFSNKRINIKWEVPEGTTAENATEFTFTYELQDDPQQQQAPAQEPVECTDPDCNLPKDLKHTHVAPAVVPTESPVTISTEAYESPLENLEPGDVIQVNGEDVTVTAVQTT